MGYHSLEQKCADAIRQVLIDAATSIPNAQIETAFNDQTETQVLPKVAIVSLGGEEEVHGSGVYRLEMQIRVESTADKQTGTEPRTDHAGYVEEIFDALLIDNLDVSLTAAVSAFTAFNAIRANRGPDNVEDRRFITELSLSIPCTPSDLT